MNPSLLTIAEAAKKVGRSPSTIRRLVHAIVEAKNHPDRGLVEPSPPKVEVLKKKGENFTWKIREEVVMREFEKAQLEGQIGNKSHRSSPGTDVLAILERELHLKNTQIEKQWEVIHSLNERLREGNILMGSLQKRLAPPEPASVEPVLEASMATDVKGSPKVSTDASKKTSKKGLFGWLRR